MRLSKPYPGRDGSPVVERVDLAIFTQRYFTRCLECTFCHDTCCRRGADIDRANVERLLARADELEAYLAIPRTEWFDPEIVAPEAAEDEDREGPRMGRTQVAGGACIFRRQGARGCGIHAFCLERGIDYHELKPTICWMFPVLVEDGELCPANEIRRSLLICQGEGPTLYQGQRDELLYVFGPELIAELDALEQEILASFDIT